jgi:bifunctional diaminopimelate decarboxylase / aspartate kinase
MTMARTPPAFAVLKFGGTSVSSAPNWCNVAFVVRERLEQGLIPFVVHSALSGITDRLELLLSSALERRHEPVLGSLAEQHGDLCAALGIPRPPALEARLEELGHLAGGVALVGEVSDRIRARVMAAGELMATAIGAAFLASQGLNVEWLDARTLLRGVTRRGASERSSVLSATCDYAPDEALKARCARPGTVFLTQGFIASDATDHTVLLGRGGSDTSGAYFAAKLSAARLEIWTDVPGLFSANPRGLPAARLLRELHYDEAQEIASAGAKVLHPRCILPVKQYEIPLHIYATQTPELSGTVIGPARAGSDAARVKAIAIKKGITLVSMDSPGMWHQVGFLADVFAVFRDHGLSVDLVSTSETNVTVSLDPAANVLDAPASAALVAGLGEFCRAEVIGPCAALSLVGRNIRGILHELGDALALFEAQRIYLVSQAANDLNFTFVIDEEQGDRLVAQLHELLIRPTGRDRVLGPTWSELYDAHPPIDRGARRWWEERRGELLDALGARDCAYVYELATVRDRARALKGLSSVARLNYAMKANANPAILECLAGAGLDFECVSRGEAEHLRRWLPATPAERILFTPNFAPRTEYAWALEQGVTLTLDNLHPLREWPDLFAGRTLFVRVDTGRGHGHHEHVRTAGQHSKFGIPLFELPEVARLASSCGAHIAGLHAHLGSGISAVGTWAETARSLAEAARHFPEVRVLDLGGGLPVPDQGARAPLDLAALEDSLAGFRRAHPQFELWLEPGRYLVAEAGVLLARVTQLKGKGEVRYVGVATGMNSLIRPALYGAYHEIVNLTRLNDAPSVNYTVVGPICESGDVLGHDRHLPPTREGDVLLIAATGAYGYVMGSTYNRRPPAEELVL